MSTEQVWDESARNDLRATLGSVILGEVRLAKRDHAEILNVYREAYIEEECPESEWSTFTKFAADELNRALAQHASEKVEWPEETDCDRLDRVEVLLRDRGIVLWQASPCCDTCTRSELSDRIAVIDGREPGFRDGVRGYAFFIDQNLPEMLSDNCQLWVYLGYGWLSRDDSEIAPDVYAAKAIGIAREVCECLRDEGFEVDWNGDLARKIGLSLNWQRRTMLE